MSAEWPEKPVPPGAGPVPTLPLQADPTAEAAEDSDISDFQFHKEGAGTRFPIFSKSFIPSMQYGGF